ncbi:unnamed protein product [Schistosoma curassoni]|uniref:WD_REPEATS_REGION domain-containing protein n=1 Tax=Schistosoma curassoni TaxID=6186 RepID=A0A183L2M1_9TREM|nr:unnamed protein product [Schistosoma curassoni]
MSVFLSEKLGIFSGKITDIKWHPRTFILAVASHIGKESGEVTISALKMKLALAMCNQPSVTWAGGTTLAMALGDTNVRLWDVERADNYTLAPCMLISKSSPSELKVISVSYSETYCKLQTLLL